MVVHGAMPMHPIASPVASPVARGLTILLHGSIEVIESQDASQVLADIAMVFHDGIKAPIQSSQRHVPALSSRCQTASFESASAFTFRGANLSPCKFCEIE